jgi:hypothetical protein
MVLYSILTFTFLDSRRKDKGLWPERYQAFPEFSLLLISSVFGNYDVEPSGSAIRHYEKFPEL